MVAGAGRVLPEVEYSDSATSGSESQSSADGEMRGFASDCVRFKVTYEGRTDREPTLEAKVSHALFVYAGCSKSVLDWSDI